MTSTDAVRSVSVVVPVFNSQESLPLLVERLQPVLERLEIPYELILVNDASRDASWSVIEQLVKDHAWVRGLCLMKNYGQHNALLCGLRAARHHVVVTMDDDLQNPPEEIPKLLNKLAEGFDVVYGPPLAETHGVWRNMASVLTKRALQNTMGVETARNVSAFRAFRTDVRKAFASFRSSLVSLDVLLTWGTSRFAAVRVEQHKRAVGASNYTFWKLVNHTLTVVTGFTTVPLRMATLLGFTFTGVGVLVFVYVVTRYLLEGSVPGFPFLASIIAVFSGVQLFALGIVGEYIARIFQRSMDQPTYTVRYEIGAGEVDTVNRRRTHDEEDPSERHRDGDR